jgi:hypothetical protein
MVMHAMRPGVLRTAACVFVAGLLLGGCQARTYDVAGTVTVNDDPIPLGSMTFLGEPPSSAVVDVLVENGRYSGRLPPGTYRLTVASRQPPAPEPPPPPGMGIPDEQLAGMKKAYEDYKPPKLLRIPRRYEDYTSTPLRMTVPAKSPQHDIVIEP